MAPSIMEKYEIDLLIRQQIYYLDRQDYVSLRKLWHPDQALTEINTTYDNRATINDWAQRCQLLRHSDHNQNTPIQRIQPLEILINENRALVTSSLTTNVRFTYKKCIFELESHSHLLQRLVKLDEFSGWKILSFDTIAIRDNVRLPFPQKRGDEIMERARTEIANATSRSSYKVTAWWYSLTVAKMGDGYGSIMGQLREDAAGYDDATTWQPMMKKLTRWLETGKEDEEAEVKCDVAEDEEDDDILGVRSPKKSFSLESRF